MVGLNETRKAIRAAPVLFMEAKNEDADLEECLKQVVDLEECLKQVVAQSVTG